MTGLMIGYARVSIDEQDLATQLDALAGLGVGADRIYVDKGLTGTNRARPGLRRDDHVDGRENPPTSLGPDK